MKRHVLVFGGLFHFVLIVLILFARGCWYHPCAVKAHRTSTSPHPQIVSHKHGSQCQEEDPQAQRGGWVSSEQWSAQHHPPGEWAVLHMDAEGTCTSYTDAFALEPVAGLKISDVSSSAWIELSASWNSPSCYKSVHYKWAKPDLWTLLTILIIEIAGMKPAVAL